MADPPPVCAYEVGEELVVFDEDDKLCQISLVVSEQAPRARKGGKVKAAEIVSTYMLYVHSWT